MTVNKKIILQFINDNLEWGDNAKVAKSLGVEPSTVSLVRNSKANSRRILKALEAQALENYNHAIRIQQFSKTQL